MVSALPAAVPASPHQRRTPIDRPRGGVQVAGQRRSRVTDENVRSWWGVTGDPLKVSLGDRTEPVGNLLREGEGGVADRLLLDIGKLCLQ